MPVRIIIFEENEKLRNSLISLFDYSDDYLLVGTYKNVLETKKVIRKDFPEVVLLDIDIPGTNAIKVIPDIKEVNSLTSVVVYTHFEDEVKLFDSLCAGADGYILKNTSPVKLFSTIEEVRQGGLPLSPGVAKKVLGFFRGNNNKSTAPFGLTPRETEVLELLIKGYSTKLIASKLNIAFDTSRSHLRNIYHKLKVNCGKEAIAKVLSGKLKL